MAPLMMPNQILSIIFLQSTMGQDGPSSISAGSLLQVLVLHLSLWLGIVWPQSLIVVGVTTAGGECMATALKVSCPVALVDKVGGMRWDWKQVVHLSLILTCELWPKIITIDSTYAVVSQVPQRLRFSDF